MSGRTTSKKHDDFVRERMKGKSVSELAGIGTNAAEELRGHGFHTAKQLLGQFLVMGEDANAFDDWVADHAPCLRSNHRRDLIDCLNEWIKRNL